MRAYVPLISILLLRKGVPLHHPSDEPDTLPLLSALLPQQVKPPPQISTVNPPPLPQLSYLPLAVGTPLPQLSALPLQLSMPSLQPLAMNDSPPLSVLLQGIGVPPLLPSVVRAYAPLLW